jgi:antitoxin HigA-1
MRFWMVTGTITEETHMRKRKPTHPGEVFTEDVIKPLGITITKAAKDLGVSRKTLSEIVNGRCALSPEVAVRIGKATNTSPENWLAMESKLDLWKAMQNEPKDVTKSQQSVAANQ